MNLIEENKMFDKMKAGIPVIGCQVRSKSLAMAEMLAYAGLDYVFIEGEHFPYNIETIENMARAISLGGATPIVRIPSHEDGLILSCLEAGIMGIIFPHIDTYAILESGIDVLRIGARDLSLDMGFGGKVTPEVREVVIDVCKRINDSKVILGDAGLGGLGNQEDFDFVKGLGCKMFSLGSDMALVKKAANSTLAKFNEMNNK